MNIFNQGELLLLPEQGGLCYTDTVRLRVVIRIQISKKHPI